MSYEAILRELRLANQTIPDVPLSLDGGPWTLSTRNLDQGVAVFGANLSEAILIATFDLEGRLSSLLQEEPWTTYVSPPDPEVSRALREKIALVNLVAHCKKIPTKGLRHLMSKAAERFAFQQKKRDALLLQAADLVLRSRSTKVIPNLPSEPPISAERPPK